MSVWREGRVFEDMGSNGPVCLHGPRGDKPRGKDCSLGLVVPGLGRRFVRLAQV